MESASRERGVVPGPGPVAPAGKARAKLSQPSALRSATGGPGFHAPATWLGKCLWPPLPPKAQSHKGFSYPDARVKCRSVSRPVSLWMLSRSCRVLRPGELTPGKVERSRGQIIPEQASLPDFAPHSSRSM